MSKRPPYRPRNPIRIACYGGCGATRYRSEIDHSIWACLPCLNRARNTQLAPCEGGCGRKRYRSLMKYPTWKCLKCKAIQKRLDTEYMGVA